ncbi:MAG: anti-phage dCTP deaminase [Parasphingorhabdus sp.]
MKYYDPQNPKPELVVGIAGPAGTDLAQLSNSLAELLKPYGYHSFQIRVSELIASVCDDNVLEKLDAAKFDKKVQYLMNAADHIRRDVDSGAATVPLILSRIRHLRQKFLLAEGCNVDYEDIELYNRCFIINSLKHPDEIKLLRKIYGSKFIMISAFSGYQSRVKNLVKSIQKSHKTTDKKTFNDEALKLISLDQKKPGSKIGQNLSSTFHLADFFVSTDKGSEANLKKFLRLLFGYPYITPTRDEMHMFEAQAVAFRSSDLSRQIGAVIVDRGDFVVARGCNEVPSPKGGAYWEGDAENDDNRDFKKGRDFNAVKKLDIIKELLDFLKDNVGFAERYTGDTNQLVNDLVFGDFQGGFKELRVSNLIEFGRVVHAEMHAIVEAARRGVSIDGGTIYTTTFPCHMCGRHIVAANISRVVYIEPYPKSMTRELYDREVKIDDEVSDIEVSDHAVRFEPFNGVAPRFFEQIFSAPKRKSEDGYTLEWSKSNAQPRCTGLSNSHLSREAIMAAQVCKISRIDDPEVLDNV